MKNNNPTATQFALMFIVFISLLAETARQADVILHAANYKPQKVTLAYVLVVVLPLCALYALYNIIKNKSYKAVYPFK